MYNSKWSIRSEPTQAKKKGRREKKRIWIQVDWSEKWEIATNWLEVYSDFYSSPFNSSSILPTTF